MGEAPKNDVVLVTGGSGYLGGWTVVALLKQGYRVRTTVRSLGREAEIRADVATQVDAGDRLSFFAANLLADEGWERAADGARYILHVASPMGVGEYKAQDLIRPAREGTLRVLKAGAKAGVERVVMTSSLQAALPPANPAEDAPATDETVWTDLGSRDATHYTQAKTLAEQDAWAFMRQGHAGAMTLATVLPSFIQGPMLGRDVSGSLEVVARMLRGQLSRLPRLGFTVVDVRDLADLHLKAMSAPGAGGERFAGSSGFLWLTDMARVLREHLGERASRVSTRTAPDFLVRIGALFDAELRQLTPNLGLRRTFSTAKAERMLGWRARPATEALIASAESLVRQGLV
ncbi:NAD-dependent epimerase/dehydratase family protein [Corallococcus praedator]|uniref:NAD-dependent epimerase/dehydratase family protein n=1 Tax=Corallococcus praedator TaxID=2316724 RepID=A0ABX9QHC9_9BACT|nr:MULTISPECIES: NAD-dependent epimerase/dehydratase family protein [Corallococcus]RKH33996.1 NAD-dependent epimerase/dehydratase family protein [Corallococcus sp. CA031C]RKI08074.1 NAD-dependent epimerase/dehydratase family protein [Corallococcus praedator]